MAAGTFSHRYTSLEWASDSTFLIWQVHLAGVGPRSRRDLAPLHRARL